MENKQKNEIEIKITMDSQNLNKLLELAVIKDNTILDSKRNLKLKNIYYDTENKKLAAKKVVYRVRITNENEFEATIKTDKEVVGGYSERMEYNVALTNAKPTLEGFKEEGFPLDLEELLAGEKLKPLFTVLVNRKRSLIQITASTLIEMAIDCGEIVAGSKKVAIDEVEFELIKGKKEDLIAFTNSLKANIVFKAEKKSKFKRGLELIK
jgi:inorganic triphosphatase YgiF